MAILPESYATAEKYRTALDISDVGKDTEIEADLEAMSRYIDGKCRRFFGKDSEDVERTYRPPWKSDFLWTDDIVNVTTLEINDQEITDYQLYPLNALLQPESRPYTSIYLPSSVFLPAQTVKVTGIFGWPEVPKLVERATIQLTAILRLETPRATRRIAELGDTIEVSADAQNIIKTLLDQYQRVL